MGPKYLEEELQDLRWEVDALRHERDSLVAEKGSVGSDTTMAVVGVTSSSSDRMAALIEGEMIPRQMEAAPHQDMMMLVVRGARYALRGVRVGILILAHHERQR